MQAQEIAAKNTRSHKGKAPWDHHVLLLFFLCFLWPSVGKVAVLRLSLLQTAKVLRNLKLGTTE